MRSRSRATAFLSSFASSLSRRTAAAWASMNALGGLARRCPSESRHASDTSPSGSMAMTATSSPIVSSRRPEASSPIVGIESSRSSDGLIPRRAAAVSSARAICLLTFLFVTLAFIRPRAAKDAASSSVPSAAAQVLAMRSSRATLFDRPDVPNVTPSSASRSAFHGASLSATAEMVPRITRAFRSRRRGTGIWEGSL